MPETSTLTRDEKVRNLIVNHAMVFMGMFEEAFADIAEKMTEAMGAGASAVAGALGGSSASSEVDKSLEGATPAIRSQITHAFTKMREEMEAQWPSPEVLQNFISDPRFDQGIKIVEVYDFGRPKLTEKLTDDVLASYIFLIKSGDEKIAKMFKELGEWQAGLPKPPWRS